MNRSPASLLSPLAVLAPMLMSSACAVAPTFTRTNDAPASHRAPEQVQIFTAGPPSQPYLERGVIAIEVINPRYQQMTSVEGLIAELATRAPPTAATRWSRSPRSPPRRPTAGPRPASSSSRRGRRADLRVDARVEVWSKGRALLAAESVLVPPATSTAARSALSKHSGSSITAQSARGRRAGARLPRPRWHGGCSAPAWNPKERQTCRPHPTKARVARAAQCP